MKKFYSIVLCALVCASSAEAAPNRLAKELETRKSAPKSLVAAKNDASSKLWRPASTADYVYEDGEWVFIGETAIEYDSRGNATKMTVDEDGYLNITTMTYNDDNLVTERIEAEGESDGMTEATAKRTYVYDNVVKDFCIERMGYDWARATNGSPTISARPIPSPATVTETSLR